MQKIWRAMGCYFDDAKIQLVNLNWRICILYNHHCISRMYNHKKDVEIHVTRRHFGGGYTPLGGSEGDLSMWKVLCIRIRSPTFVCIRKNTSGFSKTLVDSDFISIDLSPRSIEKWTCTWAHDAIRTVLTDAISAAASEPHSRMCGLWIWIQLAPSHFIITMVFYSSCLRAALPT